MMVIMGGMLFARALLARPLCLAVGKLCFITSLITPIMVQLVYNALPDGLFLSTYSVDELAIGNIFGILIVAVILYLIFEFPLKRLTQWFLLPKISHDQPVHSYFVSFFSRVKNGVELIDSAEKGSVDESALLSNRSSNNFNNINRTVESNPPSFIKA